MDDDKQLYEDYCQGDTTAMRQLYQNHHKSVFNFCFRYLGNRSEAEDMTSEIFIKLCEMRYRISEKARFKTWLYTVTRNRCHDQYRLKKRRPTQSFVDQTRLIQDKTQSTDQSILEDERAKHVRSAVQGLPMPMREALILREYQHLSYREIAEILNCSFDNVKVLIFRAREKLRHQLAWYMKEGDQ